MRQLLDCYCGGKPILDNYDNMYLGMVYSYKCNNEQCENFTFSTKILGCAGELWNAAINYRKLNELKSDD